MPEEPKSRKIFFYVILIITGLLALILLKNFVSVIVLSFVYSISVEPLYRLLHRFFKSERLASITTLLISFVLIFIPILLMVNFFIGEATSLQKNVKLDSGALAQTVETRVRSVYITARQLPFVGQFVHPLTVSQTIEKSADSISKFLVSKAVTIGSSTASMLANFFIFLFMVYFIIPSLPRIKKLLEELSPLDDEIDKLYIDRVTSMISTVVKGTFIVALVQGMLGGLFIWIAGVDYVLILTTVMIIASLIPVVGTGFITIPISILLYLNGQPIPALIVLLGQLIFISNIDNVIRAELVARESSLHPALMLISIFGGISVFGIWGFLYGPVIMILFVTSLEIYRKHIRY